LQIAFQIPYLDDFISKLCRQLATVILNHENVNIRYIGQGSRLKLGDGQACIRLIVYTLVISLSSMRTLSTVCYTKPGLQV